MALQKDYEEVIQANRSLFCIDWRSLLHYRDLLFLMVRRDFVSRYKQTILGPAWFLIQPILTTFVFAIVFGYFARIPTEGIPPVLFYLCGLVPWTYFAQSLTGTSNTFVENAHIFGKVYFPRLVVPLSGVISSLLTYGIQFAAFLLFYLYFKFFTASGAGIHPTFFILFLPLLILKTAAVGLGVGLWISALTVKYRDFRHLMTFLVQLWMYATPVIYPMSLIPERFRFLMLLNPMTMVVEAHRHAFLGVGTLAGSYMAISTVITLLVLVTGILIFSKVERTFMDVI